MGVGYRVSGVRYWASGVGCRAKTRHPTPDTRHPQHGFTLLEILVATAILGTAVASLFGLLSGSLGNIQKLDAPAQAMMLAQSRMNELLAGGTETGPLPFGQKLQGRWDDRFRWEAMASRYEAPANVTPGQLILVRIALDVFWRTEPGRPEKKYSLETVQLQTEPQRPVP